MQCTEGPTSALQCSPKTTYSSLEACKAQPLGLPLGNLGQGGAPGVMNMDAKSEAPATAPTRPVLTPMRRSTSVSVGMMSMYWHIYSPAFHVAACMNVSVSVKGVRRVCAVLEWNFTCTAKRTCTDTDVMTLLVYHSSL